MRIFKKLLTFLKKALEVLNYMMYNVDTEVLSS